MKTRAALAFEAKKPLDIVELAGEALARVRAAQGRGPAPGGRTRLRDKGPPPFHHRGGSAFSSFTALPDTSVAAAEPLCARVRSGWQRSQAEHPAGL